MSTNSKYSAGVTQQDIAEMLSLSRSTVAFALNPKHRYKLLPETLKLVLDKAEECGYRPQKAATVLGTGRSHVIGVIYQHGIYHAPIQRVRHLAHYVIQAGYQLVAIDTEWFNHDLLATCNHLQDSSAEGVIFCNLSNTEDQIREFFGSLRIPQVAVSCHSTPDNIEHVSADMERAFYEMTRHHLAQGSQELNLLLSFHDAELRGHPGSMVVQRFKGFERAIREAGGCLELSAKDRKIFHYQSQTRHSRRKPIGRISFPIRKPDYVDAFALGFHHVEELLREDAVPESLICSNDEIAAGALTASIKRGIAVPGRLRISGADDAPFSAYSGIPMTTICQPIQQIMGNAVRRLIELIEEPDQPKKTREAQTIPCKLIIRDSTVIGP